MTQRAVCALICWRCRTTTNIGGRRYAGDARQTSVPLAMACSAREPDSKPQNTNDIAQVSWFKHHRLLKPIGYIPPRKLKKITMGN